MQTIPQCLFEAIIVLSFFAFQFSDLVLNRGSVSSCVMAPLKRGKGNHFEVAVVITGFINPLWMSCS